MPKAEPSPARRKPRKPAYQVEDPYIKGWLLKYTTTCNVCNQREYCIQIREVTLPNPITSQDTILWPRARHAMISRIGIGCGDYAKFHRQVAHMVDAMKRRSRPALTGQRASGNDD